DKPILARPAGDLERAWRWCRRNPWLAGAVAAAVVALVAGTVVSSAFAVRSGENARRADEKARLAEENAAAADANARKADESARKATRLADYAARQRDMALESFGVLLTEVQERLKDSPEMRQVRDRLVETAANGLDRLGESSGDLAADRGLAEGRARLAHAFERLGNLSAARRQYEAAIKTLDARGREFPDDPQVRLLAATTRSDLGELIAGVDREASRR